MKVEGTGKIIGTDKQRNIYISSSLFIYTTVFSSFALSIDTIILSVQLGKWKMVTVKILSCMA